MSVASSTFVDISLVSSDQCISLAKGFDIPAAWLSAGAAAIVATLNDEHMVQLPFAALTTVLS